MDPTSGLVYSFPFVLFPEVFKDSVHLLEEVLRPSLSSFGLVNVLLYPSFLFSIPSPCQKKTVKAGIFMGLLFYSFSRLITPALHRFDQVTVTRRYIQDPTFNATLIFIFFIFSQITTLIWRERTNTISTFFLKAQTNGTGSPSNHQLLSLNCLVGTYRMKSPRLNTFKYS
ncbi:hypothetical protein BT93_G0322 [Corymbia citriodora subsp. variegata]|nr:hypothetical protein BT93_G0322 [Corymbia citriodora subsp. variegata]